MSGPQKFYITTAISYPNGQPHIGHAYEAIATDAIARFERLDGKDVYFLTGTDEHGLKMKQTAAKEGLTPRELADHNSKRFREMAGLLGLSNDDFIRTTEPRHYRASEEIWRRMQAAGVKLILVEPNREQQTPEFVADKTGARVVPRPLMPGGDEASDYVALIDYDVKQIAAAAKATGAPGAR